MGYSTYLVGKWDLGYSRWNATPTQRGFDHHFGYFKEYTSYYDYLSTWKVRFFFLVEGNRFYFDNPLDFIYNIREFMILKQFLININGL